MTEKTKRILSTLNQLFPDAACELTHQNPYELITAVTLSAQTTDAMVNQVTPEFFKRYPTVHDLANAQISDIESYIKRIGLYKNKAKFIHAMANQVVLKHDGIIPNDREALEALPGVGRKTANVVLSVAFHVPALAVDTHVARVSKRLGFASMDDDVFTIEQKLMKKLPKYTWNQVHHQFIFFGRYHCTARNPKCHACPLLDICKFKEKNKFSHSLE